MMESNKIAVMIRSCMIISLEYFQRPTILMQVKNKKAPLRGAFLNTIMKDLLTEFTE